jgi:hypothetical protein
MKTSHIIKSTLPVLILCMFQAGCETPGSNGKEPAQKLPAYARPNWRPDGRLKIAVLDSTVRPPNAQVLLYQPGDTLPSHQVIAFISADGDASEEARVVSMMLDYARNRGATGVALLGPERPNEKLALAHPLWQAPGRRVFRANVINAQP